MRIGLMMFGVLGSLCDYPCPCGESGGRHDTTGYVNFKTSQADRNRRYDGQLGKLPATMAGG